MGLGFLKGLTGGKEKKKKSTIKAQRVGGTGKSVVSSIRKARRGG